MTNPIVNVEHIEYHIVLIVYSNSTASVTYNYIGSLKIISRDYNFRLSDKYSTEYLELSNSTKTLVTCYLKFESKL